MSSPFALKTPCRFLQIPTFLRSQELLPNPFKQPHLCSQIFLRRSLQTAYLFSQKLYFFGSPLTTLLSALNTLSLDPFQEPFSCYQNSLSLNPFKQPLSRSQNSVSRFKTVASSLCKTFSPSFSMATSSIIFFFKTDPFLLSFFSFLIFYQSPHSAPLSSHSNGRNNNHLCSFPFFLFNIFFLITSL